ncbi:PucR family transcriptional regulator [Paenibacillus humicola]|uniref:PucR family transcriptional regulator n=1 Tax=Paenibacillus humicola TaxID=3110540 RepID=UPI00237BB433|nr:PucR family transcriptional regulator [Paenibacillus humicola]
MRNHDQSKFTCEDILLIPDLKDAVVLAGTEGMRRPITRVNVMEVPDVIDWVRPGEFLITSGFPFRDRPELLADIIPQLNEKGVAALGIKTKRFIDRIPERAIEIANELGFPFFELPMSIVFSDVVRDIMERVLVQEARELSLLQSRFQKLSQQLLLGEGIEPFLKTLDGMLDNPVLILDETDHLFVSPQAERIDGLLDEPAIWTQLRSDISLGVSFLSLGERRIRVYISSVSGKQRHHSLLILLEWNREHTVVDHLTIDRAGVLVELEMANINARKEVEARYIDQFLQDWITGRIVTVEDLNLRAEACGCPIEEGRRLVVGLVYWHDSRPPVKKLQQTVKQLRARWRPGQLQLTVIEGELVLLASLPAAAPDPRAEVPLAELRSALGTEAPYSICIGREAIRREKVGESYGHAKKIHDIAGICGLTEPLIDEKNLGVFRLLYLLPDNDEVRMFRDRYIEPLLEYDSKHNTLMLATLKTFFMHNRNVKKTARELYTHYNTVSYRVERACELLEIDSQNGDDMLQLQLAMKLHDMRPAGPANGMQASGREGAR